MMIYDSYIYIYIYMYIYIYIYIYIIACYFMKKNNYIISYNFGISSIIHNLSAIINSLIEILEYKFCFDFCEKNDPKRVNLIHRCQ